MTEGPAKPTRLRGSAIRMSPSIANDAVTPPKVGSVLRQTHNRPASCSWASAWLVFAICIRETQPSCILAPPEAEMIRRGRCRSRAISAARVTISPTAAPMLPPMNPKSMAVTTSG